ncbi:biotin transport system substrate-specific component [Albidovulum inexpectatum]|uniref:Biotin transporter n=1 Tax=Albidovulum inexpectatum TaxID=196587 RepID=A0A2S5JJV0_9RHOB|nr:biotin transporter BioY [Albidovulum inexpectatum]PPB81786.1 biotin transport system substrate-specific component [Albidovulum inexpectatum]
MTLAKALAPSQSLPVRALMVLGGSLFIAIAAQISVPMIPVPMTLQTLAILIVGLTYGARLGAATVLAYLVEGAMGLPVFANGANGAAFFGPTAGFLVGFVFMAWMVGYAADRGVRGVLATAAVCILASALLYVPGVAWAMALAELLGLDASKWGADNFAMIWQYYMAPFLLGDAVKAVLAALVVSGGWAALKGRRA